MHSKDTAFFTITVDSFSFFSVKAVNSSDESLRRNKKQCVYFVFRLNCTNFVAKLAQ